jgi:hypothetical protein
MFSILIMAALYLGTVFLINYEPRTEAGSECTSAESTINHYRYD